MSSINAAPLRAVGFRAQLNGASLWDLVQMECQARSSLVVHVKGEGGTGFLYFAEGRIVHAATSNRSGESAALEILGWTNGSFQPCDRAWPVAPTIQIPCEALILNVAKRRDDDQRASNLVAFPLRGGPPTPAISEHAPSGGADDLEDEIEFFELEEERMEGMIDMGSPNIEPPSLAVPLGRGEPTAEFPVVLRLGANGAVLKNKGGDEELAGVIAYAHRLVQLAGELLGLDEFVAMECTFAEGRCLVFREENGDTVALRPRPDASLQGLRDRLGL
jgi:hypothetical protein